MERGTWKASKSWIRWSMHTHVHSGSGVRAGTFTGLLVYDPPCAPPSVEHPK